MKLRARLTGAVLVGTLSMVGLAACGSDDSDSNKNDDKKSSETDAPSDEGSDDSSSEGDGDKPSKDEVIAGYTKFISDSAGGQLPEGMVNELITCIIDGIYDGLEDESAQALANSTVVGVTPEDAQELATASGTCTQEVMGQG